MIIYQIKLTIGDLKNFKGSNGSNKVSLYAPPKAVKNPGTNPQNIVCGSFKWDIYINVPF